MGPRSAIHEDHFAIRTHSPPSPRFARGWLFPQSQPHPFPLKNRPPVAD